LARSYFNMPLFDFKHKETGEIREIFFRMNDEKIYRGENEDEEGQWVRLFSAPYASIDTKIDAFSQKQFVEKTGNKKGTIGDIQDRAAELSQIRAQKNGFDPVREKYIKNYEKTTGKKFLDTKSPKVVEKNGFKVRIEK